MLCNESEVGSRTDHLISRKKNPKMATLVGTIDKIPLCFLSHPPTTFLLQNEHSDENDGKKIMHTDWKMSHILKGSPAQCESEPSSEIVSSSTLSIGSANVCQ